MSSIRRPVISQLRQRDDALLHRTHDHGQSFLQILHTVSCVVAQGRAVEDTLDGDCSRFANGQSLSELTPVLRTTLGWAVRPAASRRTT